MNENVNAVKSGIVYTVSSFLLAGIAFVSTPFFTRMLATEDFGAFNNFTSWIGVLAIVTTMKTSASFVSAKYEYKEMFEKYVFSIMTLNLFTTGISMLVFNLFQSFFCDLFGMSTLYLNLMMGYIMFYEIVCIFQTQEQYAFRYKRAAAISITVATASIILSILLVLLTNQKLTGRVVGYTLPAILIGGVLYINTGLRYRSFSLNHWKYSIPICLPYIPHLLSLTLLNSMDRIMITKSCGLQDTAMYSLAYTCGSIVTILMSALNSAFAPWLIKKLGDKKWGEIKAASYYYVSGFMYLVVGMVLIAPEILLLLGGEKYREAIYVMPPIMFGCAYQLIYSMHVNIEQFYKKTLGMAIASVLAAGINYVLNYFFIPYVGYFAAAYTTLVSYLLLTILHILLVRRLSMGEVYNNKFLLIILLGSCFFSFLFIYLYSYSFIRYLLVFLYGLCTLLFVFYKRIFIRKLLQVVIKN